MDNGIDKKALFKLKSEPYLKPISDLGVGFYNLDENTAILQFQLTNNSGPLMISDNNVKSYAYFESKNGSASDVIDLEIIDHYNGIVQITIPKDFLQASTDTKVTGQVYIGVNNVSGKPEYNEVAVFREFNFEVKDALINKISSFTKIGYIRMFDQLKMKIEQQLVDIQEAIAKGADYVAEMKSVLQRGIETLNAIVADGETDIQTYITQAKSDLDSTKDDAIGEINTVSNNAKTSVNETADGVIKNINNVSGQVTKHVDDKLIEFNGLLETEGFITPEGLGNQLDELEWQKSKLVGDNGSLEAVPYIDLNNPEELLSKTCFVYISASTNRPANAPANGYLSFYRRTNDYMKMEYIPYNSDRVYHRTKFNGTWLDWTEITNFQSDTGWIPYNTINGVEKNTVYKNDIDSGFDCAYRIIKQGDVTTRKLRVNARNLTQGTVFAELPNQFAKNTQTFLVRTPRSRNSAIVEIKADGKLIFQYYHNTTDWTETDYIYGEFTWHD